MNMLLVFATVVLLSGCTPRINTADIAPNMSQQEVVTMLGQPESASMKGNISYLYFKIHDHAFGRDENHYVFAFQNSKLIEFAPLPDDQQEMGPIDRALRRRDGNNLGITPNAYGPGIHMDQYGRPVQVVPRY